MHLGNADGIFKTGTPLVVKNRSDDELARLEEIIRANPGITRNAVFKQTGGQLNLVVRLLKEGIGTRWAAEKGKFPAMLYRTLDNSLYPKGGTAHFTRVENSPALSEVRKLRSLRSGLPDLRGERLVAGQTPRIRFPRE
jgi:hypothetical protein